MWVRCGHCGVGQGDDGDTVVLCKNSSENVKDDGEDNTDNWKFREFLGPNFNSTLYRERCSPAGIAWEAIATALW